MADGVIILFVLLSSFVPVFLCNFTELLPGHFSSFMSNQTKLTNSRLLEYFNDNVENVNKSSC